jgi:hypothetical protein
LMKNIHSTLLAQSQEQLFFLKLVSQGLRSDQFIKPLALLGNSTIGKHFRHVIEFYQCLLEGVALGEINYDARIRNLRLEEDLSFVIDTLNYIQERLDHLENDSLMLRVAEGTVLLPTTIERELAYNTEHCIHHLAIIRMGIKAHFSEIELVSEMGYAYSTLTFQNQTHKA